VIEQALLDAPPSSSDEEETPEEQENQPESDEPLPLRIDERMPALHEQNARRSGRPVDAGNGHEGGEPDPPAFMVPPADHTAHNLHPQARAGSDDTTIG
jgi:hypothetical protein